MVTSTQSLCYNKIIYNMQGYPILENCIQASTDIHLLFGPNTGLDFQKKGKNKQNILLHFSKSLLEK